jgi:hypothetical protein
MGDKTEYESRKGAAKAESDQKKWWFKQPNPINRFTGWLVAWTALLFVGTIISAMILWQSDQTSRLANRAFVYFENPHFIPYPQEKPVVITITTNIINSGNTPAHNVDIKFDCPQRGAASDPFDLAKLATKFEPPTYLGPKQTSNLEVCELNTGFVQEMLSGTNAWYAVGEVRYTDVFKPSEVRITQMTRDIRVDQYGGASFGYVGKHNCSDQNCPRR